MLTNYFTFIQPLVLILSLNSKSVANVFESAISSQSSPYVHMVLLQWISASAVDK